MLERTITLPRRSRGRPTATATAQYERELEVFCHRLIEIDSLDFKVSSRGWGYLLEEHGLAKGDFDAAERVINDCRKADISPLISVQRTKGAVSITSKRSITKP